MVFTLLLCSDRYEDFHRLQRMLLGKFLIENLTAVFPYPDSKFLVSDFAQPIDNRTPFSSSETPQQRLFHKSQVIPD